MKTKNVAFALLACAGALAGADAISGAAYAAGPDLVVMAQGESFAIQYGPAHRGNFLGGPNVMSAGGGEEGRIVYAPGAPHQAPMLAVLSDGGEQQTISYRLPPAAMIARGSDTAAGTALEVAQVK